MWSELITFQSFNSAYNDEEYVTSLADEWLDPAYLESRSHKEVQRHAKIPVQEEEWTYEPGDKDLRYRQNPAPTPICDPVPRDYSSREFVSLSPVPRDTDPRETASRDTVEPVHQRIPVR